MASGDSNPKKPAAHLLRRALAPSASAPGAAIDPCPDPDILAAYAERSLDADETAHYELHFAHCATCRDQLAAMTRAAMPVTRAPRISWIWNWGWIALAPVTAVLLIAAIFIARQAKSHTVPLAQEAPLVAMSRSEEPRADIGANPSTAPQDSRTPALSKPSIAPVTRANPVASPNSEGAPRKKPLAVVPAIVAGSDLESPPPKPLDEKKLDANSAPSAPSSRSYAAVAAAPRTPAAPAPQAEQPGAATQRVTVESEAATVEAATEARNGDSLADNSRSNAAGAAPSARHEAANSAFVAGAVNQMVVVQAPLDRAVRTLVQSPDPQVLWRISGGRYVERSADAGATWQTQWTNATAHVIAGSAPSADTCWLVGEGGIVLLSTDARKWRTVTPPEADDFTAVSASDAESATITTKDGRQFKTRDGGKHWSPAP